MLGVSKAYLTRVAEGPFPTEMDPERRRTIPEKGKEFGAGTRRPRRCGWLDSVVLPYARRMNGLDELAVTRLDVLKGSGEVRIGVRYRLHRDAVEEFPGKSGALGRCEPEDRTQAGWKPADRGCDPARGSLPGGAALAGQAGGAFRGSRHAGFDRARSGGVCEAEGDIDPGALRREPARLAVCRFRGPAGRGAGPHREKPT